MCHFYANPLSVFLVDDTQELRDVFQPEHLEAVRTLRSFKDRVETSLEESGDTEHARGMIEDDQYLTETIFRGHDRFATQSVRKLLRCLTLLRSTGLAKGSFVDDYITAVKSGIDMEGYKASIRQLDPDAVVSLAARLLDAMTDGDPELGIEGWREDASEFVASLEKTIREVKALQEKCKEDGTVLRSKYSAQSRVLRTTVVAQKVQLSQDSAQLTEEDKAFSGLLEGLEDCLSREMTLDSVHHGFLSEAWVYDSRCPDRDVFIPRPGTTVERALARPHDYLACECCSAADGDTAATLPATAVLYRLYTEAGALINVADLWSAYYALVGEENRDGGLEERGALVRFYQGLAELKTMGFVKQSKKKADHVAKLKWL